MVLKDEKDVVGRDLGEEVRVNWVFYGTVLGGLLNVKEFCVVIVLLGYMRMGREREEVEDVRFNLLEEKEGI